MRIAWNLLTWRLGLPSSSTHALIGGLVGAALVQSGTGGVQWSGLWHKVIVPGAVSPVIGFAAAFLLLVAHLPALPPTYAGHRQPRLSIGQLFSGTWLAFTHGANDAQKTMGVIALALYTHGSISSFYIPTWVKIAAGLTIAAGTYVGRLADHPHARSADLQDAAASMASPLSSRPDRRSTLGTRLGFPISTTHVVSGSVMGAGATRRLSAVRWGVAGNIVFAWLLTLPAAALMAAALYYPVSWIF